MNLLLVIVGGFSLFVGFLGVFAIMRSDSEDEEFPKRWFVGVCADVARILRVHVALVRLLVIIYTLCRWAPLCGLLHTPEATTAAEAKQPPSSQSVLLPRSPRLQHPLQLNFNLLWPWSPVKNP